MEKFIVQGASDAAHSSFPADPSYFQECPLIIVSGDLMFFFPLKFYRQNVDISASAVTGID